MSINNLNQLKKAMKTCPKIEIVAHCRPVCVGQIRKVNLANTQGFYSAEDGVTNYGNGGLGLFLDWGKAPSWEFEDGLCTKYGKGMEHTEQNTVISFRILEEAV